MACRPMASKLSQLPFLKKGHMGSPAARCREDSAGSTSGLDVEPVEIQQDQAAMLRSRLNPRLGD